MAVRMKAQFRSYHLRGFAGRQDLEDRHLHACLGRWSARCWTSPPRPRPNALDPCVLWVPGARHDTDGQYCVLCNECKVVPTRIEASQQIRFSGL